MLCLSAINFRIQTTTPFWHYWTNFKRSSLLGFSSGFTEYLTGIVIIVILSFNGAFTWSFQTTSPIYPGFHLSYLVNCSSRHWSFLLYKALQEERLHNFGLIIESSSSSHIVDSWDDIHYDPWLDNKVCRFYQSISIVSCWFFTKGNCHGMLSYS